MSRFFLFFSFCFVDLVVEAESSPTGGKFLDAVHTQPKRKKKHFKLTWSSGKKCAHFSF